MRIYLADINLEMVLAYHKRFPERKLNVLRSFAGINRDDRELGVTHRDKLNSLILDSGTFTINMAQQKPKLNLNLDTYQSYLLSFGQHYDFYFNFDVDFTQHGFQTNLECQRQLETAGLQPVPVIHDIYGAEVEYFIAQGYELVAIGSNGADQPVDLGGGQL
ncbi:MAG: hypothetical protein ACLFUU_06300 [Desulfobacteraceae bacterium]